MGSNSDSQEHHVPERIRPSQMTDIDEVQFDLIPAVHLDGEKFRLMRAEQHPYPTIDNDTRDLAYLTPPHAGNDPPHVPGNGRPQDGIFRPSAQEPDMRAYRMIPLQGIRIT